MAASKNVARTVGRQAPAGMGFLAHHSGKLALAAILAFAFVLASYYHTGPSALSGSDNFIYTFSAGQLSHGNFGSLPCCGEDNIKYMLYAGQALFYNGVFGYTPLTASLFGLVCLLLTMVLLYLIGRKLHSERAGLIAALLYALIPMVAIESSGAGDDIPMVFFVTLSVLLVLYAVTATHRTSKRIAMHQKRVAYLMAAGFTAMINFLIVPEAAIGLMVVATLVGFAVFTGRTTGQGVTAFVIGIALALITILALSQQVGGSPTYLFYNVAGSFNVTNTHQSFTEYMQMLFPFNLIQKVEQTRPQDASLALIEGYFSMQTASYQQLEFGIIGYVFAITAAYLLTVREKRAALPAFWFAFTFLYLSFGTQSIARYVPLFTVPRFLVLLSPAIALIIAIALARFTRSFRRPAWKAGAYALTATVLLAVFFVSYNNIKSVDTSQYYFTEPLMQIASFADSLPRNAVILTNPSIDWEVFSNQSHTATMDFPIFNPNTTCSSLLKMLKVANIQLQNGSYVINYYYNGNLSACGLHVSFAPTVPSWLRNETLFATPPDYWTSTVYRYLNTSP